MPDVLEGGLADVVGFLLLDEPLEAHDSNGLFSMVMSEP